MSRIGKLPISIPAGVKVTLSKDNVIEVVGKKATLHQKIDPDITVEIEGSVITFKRPSDHKRHRSMHGLYRSLVNNMIIGVTEGFEIKQEFVGVGYRVTAQPGNVLDFALGYSHNILMSLPPEIEVEVKAEKRANPLITLRSVDKQLLGQIAAKIRSLRAPEPYKGKGIKYVGEVLRRKAGKTASK